MASFNSNFDFISAAKQGYLTTWENRESLARLMVLPILIKLGCLAAIIFLNLDEKVLWHGLILLPSYFAEGFLVSYIICVFYRGDDFGGDVKQARTYFDDITAAMIIYVLIKLALAFLVGMTVSALPADSLEQVNNATGPEPSLKTFMVGSSVLAFLIWSFRFMWLYVPVAMGIPLSKFLVRIQSFSSSFPMLGCWLACFIPSAFFMMIASKFLLMGFPIVEGANNQLSILIISSFQGAAEVVIAVIASIAMTYGFKSLMEQK